VGELAVSDRLVFLPYEDRSKVVGRPQFVRYILQSYDCAAYWFEDGLWWAHIATRGAGSIWDIPPRGSSFPSADEARQELDKMIVDMGHIIADSEEEANKWMLLL
jgi:hypothetical protein